MIYSGGVNKRRYGTVYILSADTTAKTASVCVSKVKDGIVKPCARASVHGTLTHSESLLPMIDFCLKNENISFLDIELATISAGPGSFTGVRIGVATVKGLAYGNENVPCVGVSSLEALAYNLKGYPAGSIILPVMDARRSQFYNAAFSFSKAGKIKRYYDDDLSDFESIMSVLEEKFSKKKIILVGDGADLFLSLYSKREDRKLNISICEYAHMYQDAFSVAVCGYEKYSKAKKKSEFTSDRLNPVYLRASQAERERNEKLSERGK